VASMRHRVYLCEEDAGIVDISEVDFATDLEDLRKSLDELSIDNEGEYLKKCDELKKNYDERKAGFDGFIKKMRDCLRDRRNFNELMRSVKYMNLDVVYVQMIGITFYNYYLDKSADEFRIVKNDYLRYI
jgi:hypothetical protein